MIYLTVGDPTTEHSLIAAQALIDGGADVIELGIPFSDPLADGPTIQAASHRALSSGVSPADVLAMASTLRQRAETPMIAFTYANPLYRYGYERFAEDASSSGIDGVLITDLPPDEAGEWSVAASTYGLDTVFLLAPTSTDERVRLVAECGSGFIYCVSRTGVTGTESGLSGEIEDLVRRTRTVTTKPVVVGFGISTADDVRRVCGVCDGAVVGSAIVEFIHQRSEQPTFQEDLRAFAAELKKGTRR